MSAADVSAERPSPDTIRVVNPATELTVAEVDRQGKEAADAAVERARRAFPAWRDVSPGDRTRLLRRFAEEVEAHAEELALLETRNVGKPIGDSRGEVAMVADVLHFYSGAVEKHRGATIPVTGGVDLTWHEPLGVVAAIVPWNFPIAITSWKIGPALACGNTVVVKPAELTPLTAMRLAELALDAGIPEGVLEVVVGRGTTVGTVLVEHPDVAKVTFTGSTEAGRDVMARASGTVKRVTLELGGKSANVVFADADLERAAASAPSAVFGNAGQDCCARSRILVEHGVFDRFVELLVDATEALVVGDPEDSATQMGPLVSTDHRARVAAFLDGPDSSLSVAGRSRVPDGPGLVVPSHRPRPGRSATPDLAGGGLRARRGGDAVRRRGACRGPGQRHPVRPVGLDLDAGLRSLPADGQSGASRRALGELEYFGAGERPLRRDEAVGLRARTGHGGAGIVLRREERLSLHRGLITPVTPAGIGDEQRGSPRGR